MLRELLVFKGGNALDFVWNPNRSTRDLDFSADHLADYDDINENSLKISLLQALAPVSRSLNMSFAINRVEQQPPGVDKNFITYTANVQYALPDQASLRKRIASREIVAQVIPVEVSLNEPICADERVAIDTNLNIRVSTPEDIVAEKLRALLQQPIRDRTRPQDLLDIAVLLQETERLDPLLIADYLARKAEARNVSVSRAAFHDDELARRAEEGYAELEHSARRHFIPFRTALTTLQELVSQLPIPEE